MKKTILAVLAAVISVGAFAQAPHVHPAWTYDSVVYEVNIRQYSPEGTFRALESQLPRLKALGVDVLWLMPMYEIGVEGRKGTLGSYYAISDYKKVNPEFGTMEDFEHLLAAAHAAGFKVILDWVANQTAPDNVWMTGKPADFYERDANGNAIWEYDWTDTRSLNYENEEVWWAQEDAMRFWLDKGVDGFRCDAAGEVPPKFWGAILPRMRRDYPEAYILAEAERPDLAAAYYTFDASYAWELHHLLNNVAKGFVPASAIREYVEKDARKTPPDAFRLSFTSNHDENSWAGTEFEREGSAANACAVLCFTLPKTQPLIYTGQEIGLNRRLEFFEKDPITDWSANQYTAFWQALVNLKHDNPALDAGEKGGAIEWLPAPEGVVAFRRTLGKREVIVLANFGVPVAKPAAVAGDGNDNRPQGLTGADPFLNLTSSATPATVDVALHGKYREIFTGKVYKGKSATFTLAPAEYIVLSK